MAPSGSTIRLFAASSSITPLRNTVEPRMPPVEIKIDFHKLADIAARSARRGAAFLSLGQRAWSDDTIASVKLDLAMAVQLLPDPLPSDLAAEVRSSFRLWISGSVLAEIVQGLSLFADDF